MTEKQLLKKRYTNIVLNFSEQMKERHRVLYVLLTGSYYTDKLTESSDLDVFLITDNESRTREKGVILFEGVKISYFLNPYWKVMKLVASERGEAKRPTAETVFFSACLKGQDEELKRAAKETLQSLMPKLGRKELVYLGWKLYDKAEIFKRKNYDRTNKEYLKFDLFELTINIFFLLKRSYRPHAKYTLARIKMLDKKLYEFISIFLKDKSDEELLKLADYLFNLMKFKPADYYRRTRA